MSVTLEHKETNVDLPVIHALQWNLFLRPNNFIFPDGQIERCRGIIDKIKELNGAILKGIDIVSVNELFDLECQRLFVQGLKDLYPHHTQTLSDASIWKMIGGVQLFSKHPILSEYIYYFSELKQEVDSYSHFAQTGYVITSIERNGDPHDIFHVVSLHLVSGEHSRPVRLNQLKAIKQSIETLRAEQQILPEETILFLGDFNEDAQDPEWIRLLQEMVSVSKVPELGETVRIFASDLEIDRSTSSWSTGSSLSLESNSISLKTYSEWQVHDKTNTSSSSSSSSHPIHFQKYPPVEQILIHFQQLSTNLHSYGHLFKPVAFSYDPTQNELIGRDLYELSVPQTIDYICIQQYTNLLASPTTTYTTSHTSSSVAHDRESNALPSALALPLSYLSQLYSYWWGEEKEKEKEKEKESKNKNTPFFISTKKASDSLTPPAIRKDRNGLLSISTPLYVKSKKKIDIGYTWVTSSSLPNWKYMTTNQLSDHYPVFSAVQIN